VAGAVGSHVLELEPLGQVEVVLDGAQLPGAADGVLHVDVDLRTVEGGVALLDLVLQAVGFSSAARSASVAASQPSSVPTYFSGPSC
jgi:hypothetical protein